MRGTERGKERDPMRGTERGRERDPMRGTERGKERCPMRGGGEREGEMSNERGRREGGREIQ